MGKWCKTPNPLAPYSHVTDAEEFIYRNLQMGFNIKVLIKQRCNSICAPSQPPQGGTHNTNIHNTSRQHSLHNRHNDGAPPMSSVPSLPLASDTNSQLSGKTSATHHISQLENIINTKYLSYKEPTTVSARRTAVSSTKTGPSARRVATRASGRTYALSGGDGRAVGHVVHSDTLLRHRATSARALRNEPSETRARPWKRAQATSTHITPALASTGVVLVDFVVSSVKIDAVSAELQFGPRSGSVLPGPALHMGFTSNNVRDLI